MSRRKRGRNVMGQPTADEEFASATETTEVEQENDGTGEDELEEVDSSTEPDEVDEVDEKPTTGAKKATKKASARPPVPEGFIAPVAFAKVLTTKLIAAGKIAEDEVIPPQMVYSYIQ